jgi:hypothetical protein
MRNNASGVLCHERWADGEAERAGATHPFPAVNRPDHVRVAPARPMHSVWIGVDCCDAGGLNLRLVLSKSEAVLARN